MVWASNVLRAVYRAGKKRALVASVMERAGIKKLYEQRGERLKEVVKPSSRAPRGEPGTPELPLTPKRLRDAGHLQFVASQP